MYTKQTYSQKHNPTTYHLGTHRGSTGIHSTSGRGRSTLSFTRWSDVHDVFHVSQLRKCLRVPEEQVAPETIDLQDDLRYQEVPVKILDTVTRRTRNSEVRICRVQWSRHSEAEATWEREDAFRAEFPSLFSN